MLKITHKTKSSLLITVGVLLCSALAATFISPTKASAETLQLSLACRPNAATVAVDPSTAAVSCVGGSAPNETVYVAAVGTDTSSLPDNVAITTVTVNCGSIAVAQYHTGDAIPSVLRCHTAKKPAIAVISTTTASGTNASNCSLNDGTCASCYRTEGCIDCTKINCTDVAKNCGADHCDLVQTYVNPIVDMFSAVVGLVIVISLIWGGIQYSSSGGDPQKASAAKSRLTKTLMAFFMYAFLFSFLQFIIPGGAFNR